MPAAKKTASKTAAPASGTDFNFASLTPVAAEPVTVKRTAKANPLAKHVMASNEGREAGKPGKPLALNNLPSEEVAKRAAGMIQRAADAAGVGVSKEISGSGSNWTVTFQTKDRRKYSPRATK